MSCGGSDPSGWRKPLARTHRGRPMPKILLVEDHEEIWDFLSRRLKRRGYEVVVAQDGQQGLDKTRAESPDLVLLDMNLPVMDGWTLAQTLKGDAATKSIPIIALTA